MHTCLGVRVCPGFVQRRPDENINVLIVCGRERLELGAGFTGLSTAILALPVEHTDHLLCTDLLLHQKLPEQEETRL